MLAGKTQTKVAESAEGDFDDLSVVSRLGTWLAYTAPGPNLLTRIFLYEMATGRIVPPGRRIVTTVPAPPGARTASGSTSCPPGTSNRS